MRGGEKVEYRGRSVRKRRRRTRGKGAGGGVEEEK